MWRFGWAQLLYFGLFGVLLIGLAVGLYRAVRPRPIARVGPVLLAIAGVGLLLSMFPTDHGPPNAPSTWHGDIHAIAFLVVFIPLLLSMFFFAVSFRHDPRWTGLVWVGPISGAAALIAFIGLGALLPASLDQVSFYADLLALFVGITVIAYRLRALYPRDNVTPGSENLPPR